MPRMLAVVVLIISETSRTLVSLFVGDRDWTQLGSEQLTHPSQQAQHPTQALPRHISWERIRVVSLSPRNRNMVCVAWHEPSLSSLPSPSYRSLLDFSISLFLFLSFSLCLSVCVCVCLSVSYSHQCFQYHFSKFHFLAFSYSVFLCFISFLPDLESWLLT